MAVDLPRDVIGAAREGEARLGEPGDGIEPFRAAVCRATSAAPATRKDVRRALAPERRLPNRSYRSGSESTIVPARPDRSARSSASNVSSKARFHSCDRFRRSASGNVQPSSVGAARAIVSSGSRGAPSSALHTSRDGWANRAAVDTVHASGEHSCAKSASLSTAYFETRPSCSK